METRNASPSAALFICGLCNEKFDQTCDLHRHHRLRHQFLNEDIEFHSCCKHHSDQQRQGADMIFNKPFTLECCKATIPTLCCLEQHHCYGYGGYLVETVDFIVSLSRRNIRPLPNSETIYKTILPGDKPDNPCYVSQDKCMPETSQQKITLLEQTSHLKNSTSIPNESDWLRDSLSNCQQDLCNINSMQKVGNSSPNDKITHSLASILDKFTVVTIVTQQSLENCTGIESGPIEHQQTPLLDGQNKTGSLENNCFYEKRDALLYENVTDMQPSLLENRYIIPKDVSDFGNHCNTPTESFAITEIADPSDCAVLDYSAYEGYMMKTVSSGPLVENGNENENSNHKTMSSAHKNEDIVPAENMPPPLNLRVESIHDVTDKDKSNTLEKPENSNATQEPQIKMAQNQLTQFKCKVCNKVFPEQARLKKHVNMVHSNNAEQCDVCQKIFKNETYMRKHKKLKHGYTLVKDQECVYCRKKFSTKLLLTKHLALVCSKTDNNKTHRHGKITLTVDLAEDQEIHVKDDVQTPYVVVENIEKEINLDILQPSHELDHQYCIPSKSDDDVRRTNDLLTAVPHYPTEYQSATYHKHISEGESVTIPSDDNETKTTLKSRKKVTFNNAGKKLIIFGFQLHYRKGNLHTKCTFCDKSFLAKNAFHTHIRTHTNHPDFNSKFIGQLRCLRSFMQDIDKDTIIVPKKRKSKLSVFAGFEFVPGSSRLRIICKACNVIFHRKEFIEHAVDCYRKNGLDITGEFLENLKTLKRSVPLWKVKVPKHKKKVSKTRKLKTKPSRVKKVPGEKVQCPTCNNTVLRSYLSTHTKQMHSGVSYPCEFCGKMFRTQSQVKAHVDDHSLPRLQCDICKKMVSQRYYRLHKKYTHGPKQHECKICNKKFGTWSGLHMHSVIHSDARPYECKFCSARFKRNDFLKVHVNSFHDLKRCWRCPNPVCRRVFKVKHTMEYHALTCSSDNSETVARTRWTGEEMTHFVKYFEDYINSSEREKDIGKKILRYIEDNPAMLKGLPKRLAMLKLRAKLITERMKIKKGRSEVQREKTVEHIIRRPTKGEEMEDFRKYFEDYIHSSKRDKHIGQKMESFIKDNPSQFEGLSKSLAILKLRKRLAKERANIKKGRKKVQGEERQTVDFTAVVTDQD